MPRDEAFVKAVHWLEAQTEFNGLVPSNPRSTNTPNRSNWRCDLTDGSRLIVTAEPSGEKSRLTFTHTNIPSNADATK